MFLFITLITGKNFASEDIQTNLDNLLIKKGMPIELIEEMGYRQKQDIVEIAGKLISHERKVFTANNLNKKNSILGVELLPKDEFTLTITTFDAPASPNGNKRIIVYTNYYWHTQPFWTGSDPFAISWSPSIFRPVDRTTYARHEWRSPKGARDWKGIDKSHIAYSSSSGVGWYSKLKTHILSTENRGFARVAIETIDQKLSGTSQIHSSYIHTWGIGTNGISFNDTGITFTGSKSNQGRELYQLVDY